MKRVSTKILRLEKQMLRILAKTLQTEIFDQQLQLTSFSAVKLSGDKSDLKVYFNHLNDHEIAVVTDKLNAISGLFRSHLAQQLTIYKVPKITFIHDTLISEAKRIEAIINESLRKIKPEE